jgi:hypothetical protein
MKVPKQEKYAWRDGTWKFSEEQLQYFEEQVTLGVPVKQLAQTQGLPSEFVLWKCIANERSELHTAYARGKQTAVARYEEEIELIASTPITGEVVVYGQHVTKDGDVVPTEERRVADMLGHRQLLIDTHKWTLAHIRPKKHGRLAAPAGNEPNEQLEALFQALQAGPVE